jgi:hypothetical protein
MNRSCIPDKGVITADQVRACLAECSQDTQDYVNALADELSKELFAKRGGLTRFGVGSGLELIAAMMKEGLV